MYDAIIAGADSESESDSDEDETTTRKHQVQATVRADSLNCLVSRH